MLTKLWCSVTVVVLSTVVLQAQNYHGGSRKLWQKPLWYIFAPTIQGSGVPLTNERVVAPFHAVAFEDPFTVLIQQGERHEVRIISDDNIAESIHTKVSSDGVLSIVMDAKNYTYDTLAVVITAPALDSLALGFATSVRIAAPLYAEKFSTALRDGREVIFDGGEITHHHIYSAGLFSLSPLIDAARVSSEKVTLHSEGISLQARVQASQIAIAGSLADWATVFYTLYNQREPVFTGKGVSPEEVQRLKQRRQLQMMPLPNKQLPDSGSSQR